MANFNNVYKWIVSLVIAMVVIINSKNVVNGHKLRGKIDLAIFLAPLFNERHIDAYKKSVIKMIDDHLDIGVDNVRVALFDAGVAGKGSNVVHRMSDDRVAILQALTEWSPVVKSGDLHAVTAMLSCWSACEFEKNDRAKAIIIHLQYYSKRGEDGANWAGYYRQMGAYVYIVTDPNDRKGRYADWTGSSMRLFQMTNSERESLSSMKMPEIINAIEKDLCGFCRFNAPGQNDCEWKRFEAGDPSYSGSDHAACNEFGSSSCESGECEWKCDREWPWANVTWDDDGPNKPNCTAHDGCGTMRRDPISPPSTIVENCNPEFDCRKPECQTTTSTTTSTTTTTTSTSTTSSTSTPTTTTSTITSTITPTTSTASTIAPPTSTTKSTTTESDSTTGEKKAVDNGSATSDSKDLPAWVIAVIVVVAVVLLLAIVIGIVVMKKRKLARQKKEKMERAKRLEEVEKREKIEVEKKGRDTTRSKSVSVKDVSVGSKSKGADASVDADITVAIEAVRQSKKSSEAAACKMKTKAALSDGEHESKGGDEKPSKKIGIEGSKMTAKSSQQMSKGKLESKSSAHVVEEKKSEPPKMGSSSMVSKKK